VISSKVDITWAVTIAKQSLEHSTVSEWTVMVVPHHIYQYYHIITHVRM